jgi:hypothetical protein
MSKSSSIIHPADEIRSEIENLNTADLWNGHLERRCGGSDPVADFSRFGIFPQAILDEECRASVEQNDGFGLRIAAVAHAGFISVE